MPDKLVYALAAPSDNQVSASGQRQPRVATSGVLDEDVGETTAVSTEPATEDLTLEFRNTYAELMAAEYVELSNASGYGPIPVFGRSTATPADGYYAIERVRNPAVSPREPRFQRIELDFRFVGTDASHVRALRTSEDTVDNPFGTGTSEELAISARAEDVRWIDALDGSAETASPVETREGETDYVDVYDATNSSITDPTLVYGLAFEDEYPVDCRVWDDYDRDKRRVVDYSGDTVGDATVGSASVGSAKIVPSTWQRCFRTDHRFIGNPVLESGLLRLVHDRDRRRLMASRYNPAEGQYNRVQLGTSAWRLHDLDLRRVGPERIAATTRWRDDTGDERALALSLKRGWGDALWTVPDGATAPPQGLLDRLSPIAATTERSLGATQGLITRSEVPLP